VKKIILILLSLITALTISLGLIGCGGQKNGVFDKTYTIEYGSEFSIPSTVYNYKVTDSKGKAVVVYNGRFIANDIGGYKITSGKDVITITVVDTTAPVIDGVEGYITATIGEEIDLRSATSEDVCTGLSVVNYYKVNGNEKTSFNGVVEVTSGEQKIVLESIDGNGNKATKNVFIEGLEENSRKAERITAFSSEYGLEQISGVRALVPSYSTEERYNGENGSLKLKGTLDVNQLSNTTPRFTIKNALIDDITNSWGMYFAVKNTGVIGRSLTISNTLVYNLAPDVWTEIYVSNEDFENIAYEQKLANPKGSVSDLTFTLSTIQHGGNSTVESVYISDIYYLPIVPYDVIDTRIGALTDVTTQEGFAEWKYLNMLYSNLSQTHIDYMHNASALNYKYLSGYANKFGVTTEEMRLSYNDSEFATYQFVSKDKSALMSYDATMSCTTNGKNEVGSMKVQTGDTYGASLTLKYPITGDNFSTRDFDDYDDSIFGTLSFSVYFVPSPNKIPIISFADNKVTVEQGKWVNVTLKVSNRLLTKTPLYFYALSEYEYGGWLDDATFYITSIYATPCTQASEVDSLIETLLDANVPAEDFDESELFQNAYKAFADLSMTKRTMLSKGEQFKQEIVTKLGEKYQVDFVDGKVFYFDNEFGTNQVLPYNSQVEYTEEVKYNGNGVLKITFTGNRWDIGIDLLFPYEQTRNKNRIYKFYVMVDGSKENKINFGDWSNYNPKFSLKEDTWVEFTTAEGTFIDENRLYIFANDWATLLPQGLTLYVSAIEVVE